MSAEFSPTPEPEPLSPVQNIGYHDHPASAEQVSFTPAEGSYATDPTDTPAYITVARDSALEHTLPQSADKNTPPFARAADRAPLPPIDQLPEYDLLIGEGVRATPDATRQASVDAPEAHRTRLSDNCLREAYHGEQQKLSGMSPQDFAELHSFVRDVIGDDPATLEASSYFMGIHDIGKNDRVRAAIGAGEHVDHDEVFVRLLCDEEHSEARRALLPSFDLLPPESQDLLKQAAKLNLNYPQVLQGEAPAAMLRDMHEADNPQARDIDIVKAIFDIAGAAGHVTDERSLTMTSATWQRMRSLNDALRDPDTASYIERNNAYLDNETRRFATDTADALSAEDLAALRPLTRLSCHLRTETPEAYAQLKEAYDTQPASVRAILGAEMNRDGVEQGATLPYYGPQVLRELTNRYGADTGLQYYAHILQEAHLTTKNARAAGETGVVLAELGDVATALIDGSLDPRETCIRFAEEDGALTSYAVVPTLTELSLPTFETGETLRGKRAVILGIGGGSDGVQAAAMRLLLKQKYGLEDGIVVSVRNAGREVEGTGEQIGTATKEVTADTRPIGSWRFLENIPLEGPDPANTYIMNTINPEHIQHDLAALTAATGADVIIALDTGGDSLFRTDHGGFSASTPTEITSDQDRLVLQAVNVFANDNPDVTALSMVVAPGIDSPIYAHEVLDQAGAAEMPLTTEDTTLIKDLYAVWRMDGSGSEEGRYGKTPLAWLHALNDRFGVQALDLPTTNVTASHNPWRAFLTVTPAMASVVVMDARAHYAAAQPQQES